MTQPNPYMTLAGIQNLANSNSDPLKDWNDSIGIVNSPDSGLSGAAPTQEG